MKNGRVLLATFVFLLVVGLATSSFAQGRGRGGGGGGGRGSSGGSGIGNPGGPPPGVGVDRGIDNSSKRSGGRSDSGLATASERSGGRSDQGIERARVASSNLRHADEELRNNPGISRTLHTNANDLRSRYQTALASNPNLKFGQFVAATRLEQNLGSRNRNITREAILAGLASGNSLGRTLQNLGLSERDANEAKKRAERETKRNK